MTERLFRTSFTNGHCHYYASGAPNTRTADQHYHQIVYTMGHACIVDWEDGHSHEVDPEDRAALPEVPFD